VSEQRPVTPEAVALELPLASVGSRFLALVIDWAIQLALLVAVLFAGGVATNALDTGDHGIVGALAYVVIFLAVFGYPVAFETLRRGRTPGKAALGLRVVTREGGPERFRHAAIRAALGLVDFLLTAGAAAVVSTMTTRNSQRLGDLVAGTVVVRERSGLKAPAPVTFAVPAGLEAYASTLDVAGLSTSDHTTVRSFLLRAPSLPPEPRARIAASMAATIASKLRTSVPDGVAPESFLHAVLAVSQARSARDRVIGGEIPRQSPDLEAGRQGTGEFAPPT
jgi:uncharacterized RDD family membrane protein YckC